MRPGTPWRLPALLVGLALLGCGTSSPPPARGPSAEPPIRLAVGQIDVEDRRQPLAQANFIDERRGRELADETTTFLRERLLAEGGARSAVAVIEEASLTERLIEGRSGGVVGFVTGEATWQLDGRLAVRVILRDAHGTEQGFARALVERQRSLPSRATFNDRENAARLLKQELLQQLDPALTQTVRENLTLPPGA